MPSQVSTKVIVCKCISLGVALFTMALVSAAYDRGKWYHVIEEEIPIPKYGGTIKATSDPEGECNKREDQIKAVEDTPEAKQEGITSKPCPSSTLVILSIGIAAITFVVTIISLTMSFAGSSNQNNNTGKIDFVINLVSGILQFLSVLLLVSFTIMAYTIRELEICKKALDLVKQYQQQGGRPLNRKQVLDSNSEEARHSVDLEATYTNCDDWLNGVFQHYLLMVATFFALVSGVMLIITAVMVKSNSPVGVGNQQMMMMNQQQQMSMAPTQFQSYQQQQPYYQQQQQPYYQQQQQMPFQGQGQPGTPSNMGMQGNYQQYQQQQPPPQQ